MKIVVVDGQGGGIGRMLVMRLKAKRPGITVIAAGTNAIATQAMLRAGADAGATGENAVVFNCQRATLLLGPSGIAIPNAMLGEITPAMAAAVSDSPAMRFLLPMHRCDAERRPPTPSSMETAADALVSAALAALFPGE